MLLLHVIKISVTFRMSIMLMKLLRKCSFFDEVMALSQILLPIKNAIKLIEGDNTTLADVFVQMIRLTN